MRIYIRPASPSIPAYNYRMSSTSIRVWLQCPFREVGPSWGPRVYCRICSA